MEEKIFPAPMGKILLIPSSCPAYVNPQVPVVAPAGSVLRVRLDQALDTGRGRPGDRFEGAFTADLNRVDLKKVSQKRTIVAAHVLNACRSNARLFSSLFSSLLSSLLNKPLSKKLPAGASGTGAAAGIAGAEVSGKQEVLVPEDSVSGFTLKNALVV
jgi:hypothetical protein